jgi:hypothetical protein
MAATTNGVRLTPLSLAAAQSGGQPPAAGGGGLAGRQQLDWDLQQTIRRTSQVRKAFYVVVLLVALGGQVSGAVEGLGLAWWQALPGVAALELGGVVVLANADVRRRLGEKALVSRLLSAGIAGFAVAFNWLAHANHLLGAFFAGMSALGYLVWLMHTENQRRDRLRARGDLPPTPPAYELVGHWLHHPWLTLRAKNLAKADPRLGLYGSIAAARAAIAKERRTSAIAKVLHRKIRAAVDPSTADIAVAVYDLDEIALRLADGADYDGLTTLIAADLAPARLAPVVAEATVAYAGTAAAEVLPDGTGLALPGGTAQGGTAEPGTGTSRPRRSAAPKPRGGGRTGSGSVAGTGQAAARALWDERVANGGVLPSTAELTAAAEVSPASGVARRWRRAWLEELQPGVALVPAEDQPGQATTDSGATGNEAGPADEPRLDES